MTAVTAITDKISHKKTCYLFLDRAVTAQTIYQHTANTYFQQPSYYYKKLLNKNPLPNILNGYTVNTGKSITRYSINSRPCSSLLISCPATLRR